MALVRLLCPTLKKRLKCVGDNSLTRWLLSARTCSTPVERAQIRLVPVVSRPITNLSWQGDRRVQDTQRNAQSQRHSIRLRRMWQECDDPGGYHWTVYIRQWWRSSLPSEIRRIISWQPSQNPVNTFYPKPIHRSSELYILRQFIL
jgi:hypothetical protein